MTEDLSSRLKKIKAAKDAARTADQDKYKSFAKGWGTLAEDVIEPALEETERTFLLEDDGPVVTAKKEGEDRVLQVGKDDRRCHQLRFRSDWPNCRVILIITSPTGSRREMPFRLEELSKAVIDDHISGFMAATL